MTVSMQTTKRIYQGNGVSTQWDVDFPFIDVADVRVYVTSPDGVETELTANYEIDPSTRVLTYPLADSEMEPLAEGWTLTVLRKTPLTQEIDLIRQGELDAEVLEEGYDKLTLLVQELNEQVARSIKYPVSAQEGNVETEPFLNRIVALKQDAVAASAQATRASSQAQQAAESAQTAQSQADQHLQQTQLAQAGAETANTAAQAAQAAAESAQAAAQTAQSLAAAANAAAEESAAAAGASAVLARNWAAQTDGPVADDAYSARYYAQQALSDASRAEAAQTAAQTAQSQAQTAASSAAGSAASAEQHAQTCQEVAATLGNPAKSDLSNVTDIAASSAVQTALNGKAATDLSNVSWEAVTPTVAFLQKGFKVCLPDVSNGYIDIAENTPYTCPQDGWVWTQGYFTGAGGQTITASVNGNALPNIGYNGSSTYNFDSPQWFPVAKGDVWQCNRTSRFYGLRG